MLPEVERCSECGEPAFSFNGHPPLGVNATKRAVSKHSPTRTARFNGHPPLGVNATRRMLSSFIPLEPVSFNGHPPLGVNATVLLANYYEQSREEFQWAPTLGGECYSDTPDVRLRHSCLVSMGTHPWG